MPHWPVVCHGYTGKRTRRRFDTTHMAPTPNGLLRVHPLFSPYFFGPWYWIRLRSTPLPGLSRRAPRNIEMRVRMPTCTRMHCAQVEHMAALLGTKPHIAVGAVATSAVFARSKKSKSTPFSRKAYAIGEAAQTCITAGLVHRSA